MREVAPEEPGKVIRIDQARALCNFMALTSAGYKVGIIAPAHEMNAAAANSLLKTLEEPPPRSFLVLVSGQPSRLPATVRSRCQRLWFGHHAGAAAQAWLSERAPQADAGLLLALTAGAPLAALELARTGAAKQRLALFSRFHEVVRGGDDPCAVSKEWTSVGVEVALRWMAAWVRDMIRLTFVAQPPRLENPDLREPLRDIGGALPTEVLHARRERVTRALEVVLSRANVNGQLLLEDLLVDWAGMHKRT